MVLSKVESKAFKPKYLLALESNGSKKENVFLGQDKWNFPLWNTHVTVVKDKISEEAQQDPKQKPSTDA